MKVDINKLKVKFQGKDLEIDLNLDFNLYFSSIFFNSTKGVLPI